MEALLPTDPAAVGEFRILGRLGAGGMGQVYLGVTHSGRPVAVKVIRSELAADASFRARFAREVAVARQVGGFWTASVVAADAEAPTPWLATDYVSGPSLARAVMTTGPLPVATVRVLAARLAEALVAIHSAGLVHRDLKPANVLLSPRGPVVIDFGIARAVHTETAALTSSLGTPGYMAPEQILGQPLQSAADVFALGATLVYALLGRGPFHAEIPEAVIHRIVSAEPDLDGVPAELRGLIGRCLAKEPGKRPTPAQILTELGPTTGAVHTAFGNWGLSTVDDVAAEAMTPGSTLVPEPSLSPPLPVPAPHPGRSPQPVAAAPTYVPVVPTYVPPAGYPPPGPSYWPAPPSWQADSSPPGERPGTVVGATVALVIAMLGLLLASGLVPVRLSLSWRALADVTVSDDARDRAVSTVDFYMWLLVLTIPTALVLLSLAIAVYRRRLWARTLTTSLGSVIFTILAVLTLVAVAELSSGLEDVSNPPPPPRPMFEYSLARWEMYSQMLWTVLAYATAVGTAAFSVLISVILLALADPRRFLRRRP